MKRLEFSTVKRVLVHLKKYWFLTCLSILFATVSVAGTLTIPVMVGKAIDLIIAKNNVDKDGVLSYLVIVVAIFLVVGLAQWLMNSINNKITFNITKDIRNDAFDKIHLLPLSYLDSNASGGIVNRIISDVDQFAEGLLMSFTQLFSGVLTILATLGIMFSVFMLPFTLGIRLILEILTPDVDF